MRYFLLFVLLLFLIPCSAHEAANVFTENGKMGLKDAQGVVLIPADYQKLGWSNSAPVVVGSIIGYRTEEGWGLISVGNEIITTPDYHSLNPGVGNIILARKENFSYRYIPMGILNTQGETVIPIRYPSIKEAGENHFIFKRIVGKENKFGVLNGKNQLVVPAEYEAVQYLGESRFAGKKQGKWGILNSKGEELSQFTYDAISPFDQGYSKVVVRKAFGLINTNGDEVISPDFRELEVSGDNVTIAEFPRWDVLTSDNQTIHSVQFDSILPWEENRWKVVANEHEWLVDENFQAITSNLFTHISRINEQLATYSREDKVGVIYQDGAPLIKATYDSIFVYNGLIYAMAESGINRGWSIFNFSGEHVSPFNYQEVAKELDNGLIPVKRNMHWGFIDRNGTDAVPCIYDYVSSSLYNSIAVGFKGDEGIIDTKGSWVIPPSRGSIKLMGDKYYLQTRDGVHYLKHFDQGTVYFTSNELSAGDGFLVESREDGSFWKINLSGQIIEAHNNNEYDEIREKSEGFIAVKIRGRFGFIDAQDRLRIAYRYEDVQNFNEGLAAFKLMGKWGYLNKSESIVIQPVYNSVSSFHNGLAIVEQNGKKGVINKDGKLRIPITFEDITPLETGRYLIKQNGKYGLLDEAGTIVVNPKFEFLEDLPEGEVIIKHYGRYGLVSRRGDDLIPLVYDYLTYDPYNRCYLGMKKVAGSTRSIR